MTACGPARADNLLQNGGFESHNFDYWAVGSPDPSTDVEGPGTLNAILYSPYEGDYMAWFGTESGDTSISQTFSDVAGGHYRLTFYLEGGATAPPVSDFTVLIDGVPVLSLDDTDFDSPTYVPFNFQFQGRGSDTVEFSARNDNNYYWLDGVSVSPVPEPASVLLLATGMVAMMGLWMRRRETAASVAR